MRTVAIEIHDVVARGVGWLGYLQGETASYSLWSATGSCGSTCLWYADHHAHLSIRFARAPTVVSQRSRNDNKSTLPNLQGGSPQQRGTALPSNSGRRVEGVYRVRFDGAVDGSARHAEPCEQICQPAPVRPTEVVFLPGRNCSGHIDRRSERCGDNFAGVVKLTAAWARFLAGYARAGIQLIRPIRWQILQRHY